MHKHMFGEKRIRVSFIQSVLNLIGHLVGSGILFVSFYAIGWGISYLIHWFDAIHKLPPEISIFISKFELWIIYADAVLCSMVIIVGAWRFVKELGELS